MVKQLCDSRVLARALAWAADESGIIAGRKEGVSDGGEAGQAAADKTFNVANSDVFLWQAAFPAIARCFDGLEVGEATPLQVHSVCSAITV